MYLIFLLFVLNLLILFPDIKNFCSWKWFHILPCSEYLHFIHIDPVTFAIQPPYFDIIILTNFHEAMFSPWLKFCCSLRYISNSYWHAFSIQIFKRCKLMCVFDPIFFFAYIPFNLGRWNFHHHVFVYWKLYSCQSDRVNYFSGTNTTAYSLKLTHPCHF